MTIVVCDGAQVAIDSGGSNGDVVHRIQKWEWITEGDIVAVRVGNSMVSGALLEWYKGERDFPSGAKLADGLAELIVFSGWAYNHSSMIEGRRYSTSEKPDILRDYWAFGAGRDFAYGNLYGTRDAVNAAKAACHYSPHCAMPLDVFTFRNGKLVHEVYT